MQFDIFIATLPDLDHEGRRLLRAKIQKLGDWFQFQPCLFYLKTSSTPEQVFRILSGTLGSDNKLAVIDYSLKTEKIIGNWSDPPLDTIHSIWSQLRGEAESFCDTASYKAHQDNRKSAAKLHG